MSSLFFLLFIYVKKRPCYPIIFNWITKAEYSVVPLCIIIPVTRYNLLTLSKPNSFSCNVKTTSRLTIDFSGMLPGDITKYHLPHLTCLRLSVIRFLLWPVLFYAFLFFIYLKFYSFFYKIARDNLYIFYNYRYVFLYNIYNWKTDSALHAQSHLTFPELKPFSNAFICIIYVIVFLSCTFSVLCI